MTPHEYRLLSRIAGMMSVVVLFGAVAWSTSLVAGDAEKIIDASGVSGGLIVHLGCGDGRLTAALGRSGRFLVNGLERSDATVDLARQTIREEGPYGRTSVKRLAGSTLPYVDNLVNLLVCDDPLAIAQSEMLRVLAPGGVLMVREADAWRRQQKPWPESIDQWTHFLHGPDNNAVALDREVGPPAHLQWIADPIHLRTHEHLNSLSALVTAAGRIFFIIDEGPTSSVAAKPKWRLVARDAFNGLLLWKRDLGPWEGHFRLFRSGPPEIARRLVATAETVYATTGYGKHVAAFDAATGETIRTYPATEGASEIVYDEGRLYTVVGSIDREAFAESAARFYPTPEPRQKGLVAVDAESGKTLWQYRGPDTDELMPTTLCISAGRIFFQNTRELICLDAASGQVQWRADRPVYTTRLAWSAPTLVVSDGVVLSAEGSTGGLPGEPTVGADRVEWVMSDQDIRQHPMGDLIAFSAETGRRLWSTETIQGFCCPGDVFVIDGLVYAGALVAPAQQTLDVALDLKTGEVRSRRTGEQFPVGGHARCYRNKATERFLVLGATGVEFVDLDDWSFTADPWVRGTCQYGVMPAGGLLYVPPDSCACRPNARLHGFTAMAAEKREGEKGRGGDGEREVVQLERGPAYNPTDYSLQPTASSTDWPTYRHDVARSGRTESALSSKLESAWRTELGGRLSSVTVAGTRVYVSQVDAHTVYALDAASGSVVWSRTVGGPVDSPPTVAAGLVVFGSRDGWVWCLRADDGKLAWRFHAGPEERHLVARENVESVWPVHGSVLVHDGAAWFAAGRSSYLDGGIRLSAVNLATGQLVVSQLLDGRDTESWPPTDKVSGTLPDILSASGDNVFMGWTCFNASGETLALRNSHLFSATGFLDDTWWHRTYWQYGAWMRGGFGGWPQAARQVPAGRLMVIGPDAVFAFGRRAYDPGNPEAVHAGHVGVIKDGYQDSGHVDHSQNPMQLYSAAKPNPQNVARGRGASVRYNWQTAVPILVRAMLLADQTLFIAGPAEQDDNRGLDDLKTISPAPIWAVSSADGTQLADYQLPAAPVLDGMAAAGHRLVVSCVDGSVCCFAGR